MICDSDDEAQNYTTLDVIMGLILVDVVSDEFLRRFSRWSFVYVTRVILWSSFLPDPTDTSVTIHARCMSRRWGDDKEASPSVWDGYRHGGVSAGSDSPYDVVFGEEWLPGGQLADAISMRKATSEISLWVAYNSSC
jgi:hypothetical protein